MVFDPLTQDIDPVDHDFPATSMLLTVESHGALLNGRIFMAQGGHAHPTVFLLHGYPGVEQNQDLAHVFRRLGWHVVMFHYRGAWGSAGDFSLTHVLEDIEVMVNAIRTHADTHRVDVRKMVLIGHSMGGFASLMMGAKLPDIVGVASLAAFNFGSYAPLLADDDDRREEAKLWEYDITPLKGVTGASFVAEFVANAPQWNLVDCVPALANRAVCLFSASRDFVSPAQLHFTPIVEAFEALGATRLTTHVLDADHSFSDKRVALARHLVAWLNTL